MDMKPSERPAARHELTPGPSAYAIVRAWPLFFVAAGAATVTLLLVGAVTQDTNGPLFSWCLVIWGLSLLVAMLGVPLALLIQRDAELKRGYSTIPTRFDEVDTVDARTGVILRRAEDPPFATRAEYLAARGKSR